MSVSAIADGLEACRVFSRVGPQHLARLARESAIRRLPPRRVLCEQGTRFAHLGVVFAGSIRAVVTEKNGRQQLLYQVAPGETFAEIPSFGLSETLWQIAAGDEGAMVILIPASALRAACALEVNLAARLTRATATRAAVLTKRLMDLTFSPTSARVAQVLLQDATEPFEDEMIDASRRMSALTQRQLAELAGTVRVVASRALLALQHSGALELFRGRVVRICPARLARHM